MTAPPAANAEICAPRRVPLADLSRQHDPIRHELRELLDELLDSQVFIGGAKVEEFERVFADYCGAPFCIGVANGTDALAIVMRALGIGAGHEVITTAVSFFATAEAICEVGATPIFCDIDAATANIDVSQIEPRITSRTRAILPVHLYGQPVDMTTIVEIADAYGLHVIEDCAQAAGARHSGRRVGTLGQAGCYSFYPSKNLGGLGDCGAIVTADEDLARRCRILANHGGTRKYEHVVVGNNSRLDTLQAAVLHLKLRHLDAWNEQRRAVAARYREHLRNEAVRFLATAADAEHVHHLTVVRLAERDRLRAHLQGVGVGTEIHYPCPLPFVPALKHLASARAAFPCADEHARTALTLPNFPGMRDDEIEYVVDAVRAGLRQ
jgi:dTDP-4-amino-4,6-dideoxygalactose transaminase